MVLSDCGYINIREPFTTLLTQGMVCHVSFQDDSGKWLYPSEVRKGPNNKYVTGDDGRPVTTVRAEKMSKSKKNLIEPEHIISTYGVDALRIFIMSDTPYEKDFDWNTDALDGAWRYVNKMWRLCEQIKEKYQFSTQLLLGARDSLNINSSQILKTTHCYLKKINVALDHVSFHTAIAFHRELTRAIEGVLGSGESVEIVAEVVDIWIRVIAPYAPHFALEAHQFLFNTQETSDFLQWPHLRGELAKEDTVTIAVQVNGKLRHTFETEIDRAEDELKEIALSNENVIKFINGGVIKKIVIVSNKLVNVVTK
jgi:leucyl-tRNA synthetase